METSNFIFIYLLSFLFTTKHLFEANLAYLNERSNESIFKIGNLLPEFDAEYDYQKNESRPFGSKRHDSQLATISNAISFASQELNKLFRDTYNCEIDLNPANTKVF